MYKPDYEPIFSAGRHEMSREKFREKIVVGLGGVRRAKIWDEFCSKVLEVLCSHDICCEIWIDGSFITRCEEPDDIDASIMIDAAELDRMDDEAVNYLQLIDDCEKPFGDSLDIFLCIVYPKGHPNRDDFNDPDGWAKHWSREHNSKWLKGFVVISLR